MKSWSRWPESNWRPTDYEIVALVKKPILSDNCKGCFVAGAITLRKADEYDSFLLLDWRNDPLTRSMSRNQDRISREQHAAWLGKVLADPNRTLMIAEKYGRSVGTVRADHQDGECELSWTVSPYHRKEGVGKKMVSLMVETISTRVFAEIKPENTASIKIAEAAGMKYDKEENGLLVYKKNLNSGTSQQLSQIDR